MSEYEYQPWYVEDWISPEESISGYMANRGILVYERCRGNNATCRSAHDIYDLIEPFLVDGQYAKAMWYAEVLALLPDKWWPNA
jgi:hypothetical protein